MEPLTKTGYRFIMTSIMMSLMTTLALAQDSSSTVTSHSTVTTSETTWYAEPWVWAVAAAIFIIIIVALVRGNGNSGSSGGRVDKVTYSKKVSREDT